MWLLSSAAASAQATTDSAIVYRLSFPAPEHHWAAVEVTFPNLGGAPLRARMSRSSPGRYAVHEFAKNVSLVRAEDGAGRPLAITRPDVDEWRVDGHDGTVRLSYRIFGDYADGTYLGIDTTHAHLNMPATFMWAVGLEDRAIELDIEPPADSGWRAATQLFPTAAPMTFTAPNLQYFFDSPIELADLVESTFTIDQAGSSPARFRVMAHTSAAQADVDALASLIARVVRAHTAVFGELPSFEPGAYTFILDTMPWSYGDAMEHRNSTFVTLPGYPLETDGGRRAALEAISHEFFHVWNVERIRPVGLEPFDFTRENITCCLWLAEGFTEYYGPLLQLRAGLLDRLPMSDAAAVVAGAGARAIRTAVQMSEHAPFVDASVANDVDDQSRTFISHYTYGSALALALDLSLRERSGGRVSLDDYMRRLWQQFGARPAPRPGYVARPYTLQDLRDVLADVAGDRAFAGNFFDRYVEGHDVPDYAALLAPAGYVVVGTQPDRGWPGPVVLSESNAGLMIGAARPGGRPSLVPFDTPAYEAGLDSGDLIVAIDGQPATLARWNALSGRPPGTTVSLVVERRDGRRDTTTMTLAADPRIQIVPVETTGRPLTPEQRAFREKWTGALGAGR